MITWKYALKSALLVACLVWLGSVALDIIHFQSYLRERRRLDGCENYVRQAAIELSRYRYDHNNQLPRTYEFLKSYYGSESNKALTPPEGEQYIYRFRLDAEDNDIVFWDAQVHSVHGGYGCKVRNGDFRNVAYASGRVKEISEQDFEKLHLE